MHYFSIESAVALLVSLFINVCVVTVFAKAFFGKGIADIGLANAGHYISEKYGSTMVCPLSSARLMRVQCCVLGC